MCLRCHAAISATGMPAPRRAPKGLTRRHGRGRAICYTCRMARGYSGTGGRFGGRSYGGYGTTGDYRYGAQGHYAESQFGGGAEEGPGEPSGRRRLTPEEYWQRDFGPASYEGRTRGDDTGDRFVPSDTRRSGTRPAHRMARPSRHPLAPRGIRRSDAELTRTSARRCCSAMTWTAAMSRSPCTR